MRVGPGPHREDDAPDPAAIAEIRGAPVPAGRCVPDGTCAIDPTLVSASSAADSRRNRRLPVRFGRSDGARGGRVPRSAMLGPGRRCRECLTPFRKRWRLSASVHRPRCRLWVGELRGEIDVSKLAGGACRAVCGGHCGGGLPAGGGCTEGAEPRGLLAVGPRRPDRSWAAASDSTWSPTRSRSAPTASTTMPTVASTTSTTSAPPVPTVSPSRPTTARPLPVSSRRSTCPSPARSTGTAT